MDRTNREALHRSRSSLTGPAPESERYQRLLAVGVAAAKLTAPVLAKRRGGVLIRLKAEWATIVGTDWASETWPRTLARDGVLKLTVASSAALELQHRAPLLIERINLFFGRPVVTRLAFVQGPLPLPAPPSGAPPRPLAAGEAQTVDDQVSAIAEPELRAALARLGRAVLATQP